jgi:Sec-independent protein secretion pathway component TatC
MNENNTMNENNKVQPWRDQAIEHFRTLDGWRLDVVAIIVFSAVVTPADPYSMLILGVILIAPWMLLRYAITRFYQTPK